MQITLNGTTFDLPDASCVSDLLALLDLRERRVAVELNQEIVPRSQHERTELRAGDCVEVVHAIGGG